MKQSDVDLLKSLLIKKAKMKSENGSLEIDNTAEGLKARIISIESNKLYQEAREGYNELDIEKIENGSGNGVNFSIEEGRLIFNGTTTSAQYIYNNSKIVAKLNSGNYTFIIKKAGGNVNLGSGVLGFYLNENDNQISNITINSSSANTIKSNFSLDGEKEISFKIYANLSGLVFDDFKLELMIVEGTYTAENAPVFEQYGAMPSLNFGSEVLGISGDISIKNKNANYLDESKLVEKTTLGITSKRENGNIIFNGTGTSSNAYLINSLEVELEKGDYFFNWFGKHKNPYFTLRSQSGDFIQNLVGSSSNNNEINVEEKTVYQIGLHGVGTAKYTPEDTCFTLMISKKNDEKYTEYKSQTYTVSLGSKIMYGNENTKDGIVLKDGKWNWKNCWKKYILDGINNKFISKIESSTNNSFITPNILDILKPENNSIIIKSYSNYFKGDFSANQLSSSDIAGIAITTSGYFRVVFGSISDINTLELANIKLQELNASGHPLYVVYPLAKEEYEEITDSNLINQLNNLLYQLTEYDDVTYLRTEEKLDFEILVEQDKLRILKNGGNLNA